MKRGADDLEWVEMETAQVEALYQERVTKDVPEAERRPLERILSFRQQGFYRCFLLCQGESWLGYAFCAQGEPESIALLDYYAMRPGLRGQGYGAKGLKLLADRYPAGLLAEVESPATATGEEERRERCRRVAFYQRCGMVHSGIRCLLFGVTYDILWLPGDSSRQPGPLLDKIYRKVLPGALWDHLRYL